MTPGQRVPRRNTAVAAVLGAELNQEVRRTEGKAEVDLEVLLRGAEKLNSVYSMPGVPARIETLRRRYREIRGGLGHYETKVERLEREFGRMNGGGTWSGDDEVDEEEENDAGELGEIVTDEDIAREEDEIRDLEKKKRELEERVSGMERDLGGLLR